MEILALLTTLKEAGFDMGTIAAIVGVAMYLRKDVICIVDKRLEQVTTSIVSLTRTLQEHIVQVDIRMQDGDLRFTKMEDRLKRIENHVGFEKENR